MITENGITFDLKSERFGTDGLSMFYRLKDKQKDSEESLDSIMVNLSEADSQKYRTLLDYIHLHDGL